MYNTHFNEASVLYMFLTLDIRGMKDIRMISRSIHAPNHEMEDIDSNTPPTKLISFSSLSVSFIDVKSFLCFLFGWLFGDCIK